MEGELRDRIRSSNSDIFEMIKTAIMVAATDHPQEFRNNRDMIAQTLFSCELIKCLGCGKCENKDETTTVAQVLKLKQILDQNSSDGSESVLLESLSKLQDMVKSVNVLKVTGVGISVNTLRNHMSKHVAQVSKTLVKEWKLMVNEWMKDNENMQQKGGESETNPKNPTQTEKQAMAPESNPKRSLVVRIKLKKTPEGPVTPEQKVEDNKDDDGAARVLKIKGLLDDDSVSEWVVLESLKKLRNISLSVKTLQETGIRRSVWVLQKHGCKDVREIAWALVKEWKGMVDEYMKKESSMKTEIESKNGMNGASGTEEKLKATKRKMKEAYKEVEKMKTKRRIQVIEPHQLTNKGFSTKVKPMIKRQIRR